MNTRHEPNGHDDYGAWQVIASSITVVLLCVPSVQAVVDVWHMFQTEFLQLWDQHSHKGDAYPAALFGGSVQQGQQAHQACVLALKTLLSSTLIYLHFFLAAWSLVICACLQRLLATTLILYSSL